MRCTGTRSAGPRARASRAASTTTGACSSISRTAGGPPSTPARSTSGASSGCVRKSGGSARGAPGAAAGARQPLAYWWYVCGCRVPAGAVGARENPSDLRTGPLVGQPPRDDRGDVPPTVRRPAVGAVDIGDPGGPLVGLLLPDQQPRQHQRLKGLAEDQRQ